MIHFPLMSGRDIRDICQQAERHWASKGLCLRPGVIDGAISVSAVQWLCNADKSSHDSRLRLKAFSGSLYRCLAREQ